MPEGVVECRLWGRWLQLWAWPKEYVRNSFSPFFYGRLERHLGGTLIRGYFILHPLVLVFLAVWFGGALIGVGVSIYHVIERLGEDQHDLKQTWFPLVFTLGLLAFGVVLVYVGVRVGRSQERAIEEYLRDTLGATRIDPGSREVGIGYHS
jgi:hypothetical protein